MPNASVFRNSPLPTPPSRLGMGLLATLAMLGACSLVDGGASPEPCADCDGRHHHRETERPPRGTSAGDDMTGPPGTTTGDTTTTGGDSTTGDGTAGSTSSGGDTDPPEGDTTCGDWICQAHEDIDTCPFDCVPYTISQGGMGQGKLCDRDFTGFTPITQIGTGLYLGQAQGGLYPAGSNTRPATHTDAGVAVAQAVGQGGGDVCLISIGVSNTYQKWAMFMSQGVGSVANINPALRVGNGAVGSHPVDTTADPNHSVWNTIDNQIANSGCATSEVEVVWMLHAERGPTLSFMEEANRYYDDLRATAINLADHFPNLRMIYLSSRTYAGYSDRDNNPEPYAHQGAFAVKWLIEAQIDGSDPALSLGSGFPWMSWGPYLWSDGIGSDRVPGGIPGRTIPNDGMEYVCDDFAGDGIHPGMGMRVKVSDQLVNFFTTDPTATPWFLQ